MNIWLVSALPGSLVFRFLIPCAAPRRIAHRLAGCDPGSPGASRHTGSCCNPSVHALRKLYFYYFQIEWDMIVGTVFLPILNQMEISFVQIR